MHTTAKDLKNAHTALRYREKIGLLEVERQLLLATTEGKTVLASLTEVASCFGVTPSALRRWRTFDTAGALAGPTFSVRAIERLREKIIGAGGRFRLRESDLWPSMRRKAGL